MDRGVEVKEEGLDELAGTAGVARSLACLPILTTHHLIYESLHNKGELTAIES